VPSFELTKCWLTSNFEASKNAGSCLIVSAGTLPSTPRCSDEGARKPVTSSQYSSLLSGSVSATLIVLIAGAFGIASRFQSPAALRFLPAASALPAGS
jgi:hypothetical protein